MRDQDTIEVSVIDSDAISPNNVVRSPWIKVSWGTVRWWVQQSAELNKPVQRVLIDAQGNVDHRRPTVVLVLVQAKDGQSLPGALDPAGFKRVRQVTCARYGGGSVGC